MNGRNEVEICRVGGGDVLVLHLTLSETQHYQFKHRGNRLVKVGHTDSDVDVSVDEKNWNSTFL